MKKVFLGVDTSNYTTSLALSCDGKIIAQERKLLPVENGKCGLRQSEALFFHTKALPYLSKQLFSSLSEEFKLCACGYSAYPRDAVGSYMPCFLAGESFASAAAYSNGVPLYKFSHQAGHIRAALYDENNIPLIKSPFISFHISGGTSEILYVSPCENPLLPFEIKILGGTNDLNAGQAIDRLGVLLGMGFPCGAELDRLSLLSEKSFNPRVCVNGFSISFSGLQNQCEKQAASGEKSEDIAKYLFTFIAKSIFKVCESLRLSYPDLPILFAGGVMSNTLIREYLKELPLSFFAPAELSRDNACGIALLCSEAYERSDKAE